MAFVQAAIGGWAVGRRCDSSQLMIIEHGSTDPLVGLNMASSYTRKSGSRCPARLTTRLKQYPLSLATT